MKRTIVLILLLAALPTGKAWAVHTNATQGPPGVPYQPQISGLADQEELQQLLQSASTTFEQQDRPPPTVRQLRRRAMGDVEEMSKALNSRGYFKSSIQVALHEEPPPVRVVFTVDTGPRFVFDSVEILAAGNGVLPGLPDDLLQEHGLSRGAPYASRAVVESEQGLIEHLSESGYPFPRIEKRRVVADHAEESVSVTLSVDPGPWARFGPIRFTGLETIDREYVRSRIPWDQGDTFDASLVDQARTRLIQTGLFSSVSIRKGSVREQELPVEVRLVERSQRTIRGGLGYNTDEGPYVLAGWEHRNILGGAERLNLSARVSSRTYSLSSSLSEPLFFRPDQSLNLGASIVDEDTDAFDSRRLELTAIVERQVTDQLSLGSGVRYRYSRIDRLDSSDTFGLLSFPLLARLDTSDDLLDPSRGGRLTVDLAPYADTLGTGVSFLKGRVSYSRYLELLPEKRLILAVLGAAGFITGDSRSQVPADELFYAGGGGSIRGYAYQMVGDLNEEDDPLGGLSLLEVSGELRYRLKETFGVVAFLDGGRAFAERTLGSDPLLWGTGLGFRYYSPIGPVRLDLAVPLDK
ncbi:MAG: autotransporter assembly complex protein TamA, partial [Desulfohalobiaceae bacterium]